MSSEYLLRSWVQTWSPFWNLPLPLGMMQLFAMDVLCPSAVWIVGLRAIELCMEMVSLQANSDTRIWGNWKWSLYSQCIFLKNSLLLGTLVRIPTYECIGSSNLMYLAVANTDCSRQSWSILATYRVQKTQVLQDFPLDPAGNQLRR